ncbi:CD9 antigen-like [Paramacrobiotus metropolitanus]|uniref:CD9 antigen-like n=1 Tax=Paramacrobiotus metropolitanus TaxID=2943436 RepID=UPI002445C2BC|nr:CD9 antigen-like [Paramacrobiotus metropolitanus]
MSRFIVCLKWIVFIFNLLFWLCGLAILGVAIFLRVDPSTQSIFDTKESSRIQRYHVATYVLMGVGCLMAVIGFLGCCGALRQSRCMLGTFFALLLVVFIAEVTGGIVAYIHRDQLTRAFMEQGFGDIVRREYGKPEFQARSAYFDFVQTEMECCGAKSSSDWFRSEWRGGNGDIGSNGTQKYLVPLSCCKKNLTDKDAIARCRAPGREGVEQNINDENDSDIINKRGCVAKLMDIVDAYRELVIGLGVGFAIIQVLGLIFSIILCCTIKPDNYGYKS